MAAVLWTAAVAAAVSVTIWAVLVFARWWKLWKIINKIPGPPAYPLVGNALQFKPGAVAFFSQLMDWSLSYTRNNVPVFRLWLGVTPTVGLIQAETLEVLFSSSKHIEKSFVYDFLHPWLGTGLLTSKGDKWKTRRRLITPTFHFKILSDFLHEFNDQSEVMVRKLDEMAGTGEEFDVFPFITLCALDIICGTAMGKSLNAQENTDSDYVRAIYRISDLIQVRQKSPWYWSDPVYKSFGPGREFEETLRILHDFTRSVIKERSEQFQKQLESQSQEAFDIVEDPDKPVAIGGRKRLAFLDMLLYASVGETKLTMEDIQEEVDTFMFEGHDTTAAAANWAIFLIGSHPEVQRKVHEEMDRVMSDPGQKPTMDDLREMKYLECCIKEALRLYPSVPFFARTLSEDCIIGGYEVPKGVTAIVPTYNVHRDPNHWPDAEKFDPERFFPENSAGRHPYAYIPFSAGSRNCIGQRFALMEEKAILSSIFRHFRIETTQQRDDLKPLGELILRPESGVKIKLFRRE
ncbi:cytochrome P450 4V2-like isoform X3 [Branchiostoma lanceolatum]|uniref:cytochrome P450 4V2-like isoform X3 n=1 Tax=Branchiostoma lanceolatum TaxID=7740 RepID=UPI0034537AA1